ncbi:MAG: cell division protein ZapA [Proteobacteria bacterium]|nr:cell division protein ZapA [Pseudomonadota bacterium]
MTDEVSPAKLTAMRSTKITVAGRTFQIRSDAGEDYIRHLTEELNERFNAIKRSGVRQDQEFKAIAMVAIALLDELTKSKERCTSIQTKAKEFAAQMIEKIDELLSAKLP